MAIPSLKKPNDFRGQLPAFRMILLMPMPPYQVYCYRKGCGKPAVYKIAAGWSDGVTRELKTYSLTCADCLPDFFRQSQTKFAACRRAPDETLDPPGIYSLQRGVRDVEITRQPELEEQLTTGLPPGSTA